MEWLLITGMCPAVFGVPGADRLSGCRGSVLVFGYVIRGCSSAHYINK